MMSWAITRSQQFYSRLTHFEGFWCFILSAKFGASYEHPIYECLLTSIVKPISFLFERGAAGKGSNFNDVIYESILTCGANLWKILRWCPAGTALATWTWIWGLLGSAFSNQYWSSSLEESSSTSTQLLRASFGEKTLGPMLWPENNYHKN